MATNTVTLPTQASMREALIQASDALLTAQIMAGSLEHLIERIITESGGDPDIWPDLNAALACSEKLHLAVTKGLQATDGFVIPKGEQK